MKLLVLFNLVAAVSGYALPVRVLTTKEAPGVATVAGSYWVTDVQVGTPGQTFNLLIDTRGDTIWITDSACTDLDEFCGDKNRFFSNQSSTYLSIGVYKQEDHFGIISGNEGFDSITMGQIANKSTVFFTRFGQMNKMQMSNIAYIPGVDGVLGLAGQRESSFMDDAYNQGAWKQDVITYWLENQWETSDNGTNGVIWYGSYDPLHCNYSYSVPNSDSVMYKFTTTSFSVNLNGTTQIYNSAANRQTYLSTGSPYLAVPKNVAQQILSGLGLNPNAYLPAPVDCDLSNSLSFSFTNSKGTETIQGINMIIPSYDGKCLLALVASEQLSTDGANGHMELGIPFFRGRCTYLDRSKGTIGFGWPGKRVPGGKK